MYACENRQSCPILCVPMYQPARLLYNVLKPSPNHPHHSQSVGKLSSKNQSWRLKGWGPLLPDIIWVSPVFPPMLFAVAGHNPEVHTASSLL